MDLQNIFEAITPDNIKEIPVVKYCMKAFISQLRRDAKVATKISKLFDVDSTDYFYIDDNDNKIVQKDSNIVRLSKENLKKGLIQFYLNVLYKLIEETAVNSDVKAALSVRKYDTPIVDSINRVLNSEYLGGFRYFQQSSGNKDAINYIYEFSTYLERGYIVSDLKLTESTPLHLLYNGSLHESMFINFMKKMAHPAGWTSDNTTTINVPDLIDYFGISLDVKYTYLMLDSTASDFPVIWYFGELEDTVNLMLTQENYHTQEKYTLEDLRNVTFIKIEGQPTFQTYIRRDVQCKQYNLSNGMTIYDNGCVYYLSTELFNQINWESQNEIDAFYIIHRNKESFNKYLGYRIIPDTSIDSWHFVYYDECDIEMELELSHTDNNFYYMDYEPNALNISGDEYRFVQGYDEAFNNITDNIFDEYNNAFNIHLEYDIFFLTLFKIYDDYGNGFTKILSTENGLLQSLDFSSLNFIGNNLYIEFITFETGKSYLYMNNLNKKYNEYITDIISDYSELTISGYSETEKLLTYSCNTKTVSEYANGNFTVTFDISDCEKNEDSTITLGDLRILCNIVKTNPTGSHIKIPVIAYFNSSINYTPYTNKNRQRGILSGTGDTFYNYTHDNPDKYHSILNTIIEGTSIRKNYKNDNMITYINYGFRKNPSESSDCYVPVCSRYVTDELRFEIDANGFYLVFSDDLDTTTEYTPVGRYLYFRDKEKYDDNLLTEGYIINDHSFTNKGYNSVTDIKYEFTPLEKSYYITFLNN